MPFNLTPTNETLLSQLPIASPNNDIFRNLLMCFETPRPSGVEKGNLKLITNKILAFAEENKLESQVDKIGNVRIRAPATVGCESSMKIVVQSHLDIVTSKSLDKQHVWETDPIEAYLEGDFLTADRTTLGADDGIGVAAALALFQHPGLRHGPLEAVFTVDEETTMSGAEQIDPSLLDSTLLINVDSEEEHSVCIGCAGGSEKQLFLPLNPRLSLALDASNVLLKVQVFGLLGGHSGIDIHRGRANALKVLARLLQQLDNQLSEQCPLHLVSLSGGNAINAIPRDAQALLLMPSSQLDSVTSLLSSSFTRAREAFANIELSLEASSADVKSRFQLMCEPVAQSADSGQESVEVLSVGDSRKVLAALTTAPHGVLRLSPDVPGDIETSINFAIAELKAPSSPPSTEANQDEKEEFMLHVFARSSSNYALQVVEAQLDSQALLSGMRATPRFNYFPPWQPDLTSPLVGKMVTAHEQLFKRTPRVYSVHAGLECGYLQQAYPGLACASIGPTIEGAHSTDERLKVSSVEPFYRWLTGAIEMLADVPAASAL